MRKIATLGGSDTDVKRLMVSEHPGGAYLFLYNHIEDGPCDADLWFEKAEYAFQYSREHYDVLPSQWATISDTREGFQDDWIAPVRVPERDSGQPTWGEFERLEDGVWRPVIPPAKCHS